MWYTSHSASIKLCLEGQEDSVCFILMLRDGNLWCFASEWPVPERKALVWVVI